MLFKPTFHSFNYAPSGSPADAQGEITDEEVGFDAGASTESTDAEIPTEGDGGPAEPALPDLGAAFKAHNLNLPADPKELDRRFRDLESRAKQADDLQNRMNWLYHQQAQAQQAERQKLQQAEQSKPKPKIFDLPEYDPKWLDMVHRNEAGELVAKPGAMPDLPQKINAYAQAREDALNRFLSDPMGLIQGQMGEVIDQRAGQIAMGAMRQYQQAEALRKFEADNTEWVFDKGTRNLTPAAQHWNQFYAEAQQYGLADPITYATDKFDALLYRLKINEDAQRKEPTNQERKESFLEAAARKPNRTGTFEKATRRTPAQNPKKLWETLDEKVRNLPKEDFEEP